VKYPIAETFNSIQGEGFWMGTPMLFVRLAGCNVGRYEGQRDFTPPDQMKSNDLTVFSTHSVCTTIDGQRFLCDTNYHVKEHLEPEEIAERRKGEEHVCITGGEPFLHDLMPLRRVLQLQHLHVETSGTLEIPEEFEGWITCCPKQTPSGVKLHPSVIERVAEWKVLVGPGFDEKTLRHLESLTHGAKLYVQPINGVNEVWQENVERCLELLTRWPNWRLSPQLHKMVGVR